MSQGHTASGLLGQEIGFPKDDSMLKSDSIVALQKICNSDKDIRGRLENHFRTVDQGSTGSMRKDDFINIIFEVTRDTL